MRMQDEEGKVADLLKGLERVEAPAGFEQRVMRQIASSGGRGAMRRPVFLLVLKFAAPAAMLLLMGVLFVTVGDREVSVGLVPPVQEDQLAPAPVVPDPTGTGAVAAVNAPAVKASPAGSAKPQNSPNVEEYPLVENMAVEGPGETRRPPGSDPKPRSLDPSAAMPKDRGLSVGDVLSFLGATSSCGADGCTVRAVSANSVAGRSSIKAGDRIVAIDGRRVDGATVFTGVTSFRSVEVFRDGRSVTIQLTLN